MPVILEEESRPAHTEDSVFGRRDRRGPSARDFTAVRRFSADLFRIHAAGDERQLGEALRQSAARHAAGPAALLAEHAAVRQSQLLADAAGVRLPETLTPRERQVLARLARGETDAVAARVLGIATRTVSKHVEGILRKLGVETRTAAVRQGGAAAAGKR